ncbi:MAG: hypothetical protein LUG49_07710 [Oscillospiraceae bacterium]|nr:hypothetical protein [Oscillospiraceae bacterium]
MYNEHEISVVDFENSDVFGLELNGSEEDGKESSGTSGFDPSRETM